MPGTRVLNSYSTAHVTGVALNSLPLSLCPQVLPFLAVALGVDDMFVMLHTLVAHANVRLPPDVQCGITMKAAGTSITLTSLCNLIGAFRCDVCCTGERRCLFGLAESLASHFARQLPGLHGVRHLGANAEYAFVEVTSGFNRKTCAVATGQTVARL